MKQIITLCAVIFLMLIMSCNKTKNPITPNPNISLLNKTEAEVRALINGRWNLLYTINPNPPYIYQAPNSYWSISTTDSLTEVYNAIPYATSKFKLERIPGNDGRWKMTSADGANSLLAYTLDSLKTDTLISYYEWTGSKSILKKQ